MSVSQGPAEALAAAHTPGWNRLPDPERAQVLTEAEQWLAAARAAAIVWPVPAPTAQQVREVRDFVKARLAEARTEEQAGIEQETWWWVAGSYALDALEEVASALFSALEVWVVRRQWHPLLPGCWITALVLARGWRSHVDFRTEWDPGPEVVP